MRDRTNLRGRAVFIAVLAIALGGCGAGSDPDPPNPEPQTRVPADEGRAGGGPTGQRTPTGDGDGGVRLAQIGSFESPVYVTQPAAGDDAVFVVEQAGRVIRIDGERTEVFLDITDRVKSGGEQGLLSIAFAPDYARSGLLYADYTDSAGATRVVEYRSESGAPVEPSTERELLRIPQPFANHNGGLLKFGPDDLLYVGTGDGGSGGDPQRNALDPSNLLGKLLRIDPRPKGDDPYRVPSDNPFASGEGRGEIYTLGLRNPWRFSFDRETGALSIGDVGQNTLEEVNLVAEGEARGGNFGWSAFEGTDRFNTDQDAPDAIPPVLTYPTADGNCSVTGGYVVRDTGLESLYGRYLYGDFCLGELRSFVADPGEAASGDRPLGPVVSNLSSFGEDRRGRIYATSLDGPVFRLRAE